MGRCLGADLRERWVDLLEGRYSRLNFFKKKRGGGTLVSKLDEFVYLCIWVWGCIYRHGIRGRRDGGYQKGRSGQEDLHLFVGC